VILFHLPAFTTVIYLVEINSKETITAAYTSTPFISSNW